MVFQFTVAKLWKRETYNIALTRYVRISSIRYILHNTGVVIVNPTCFRLQMKWTRMRIIALAAAASLHISFLLLISSSVVSYLQSAATIHTYYRVIQRASIMIFLPDEVHDVVVFHHDVLQIPVLTPLS